MTTDQKQKLADIGEQIKALFPDMYGSIRFNLRPGRKEVNVNVTDTIEVEQSLKLNSIGVSNTITCDR